jgi:hypothetical protein
VVGVAETITVNVEHIAIKIGLKIVQNKYG